MTRRLSPQTSIWLTALTMFALVLVGCGQANVVAPSGPAIHVNLSEYGYEANTPARMCTAPLVGVGSLSTYGMPHWNTPGGARPADLTVAAVDDRGYRIYTPVTLSGFQILLDWRRQPTREYVVMGGQAGQDSVYIADYPRPPLSQRVLMVFVPSLHAGQTAPFQDLLVLYAAFPIDNQDNILLQRQSVEQGQVVGQNVTISLTDLKRQLATCPNPWSN